MKKLIPCLGLLLLSALLSEAAAQTLSRWVIGAAGSANEQLSYTTGEVVITTGTAAGSILTQGFHQPDGGNVPGQELCNVPAVHTINADTLQSNTLRASNSITLQSGTLTAGKNVTLTAGNTITFQPGFSAQPGSTLHAYIESCEAPVVALQEEETVPEPPELARVISAGELQLRSFPNPFRSGTTIEYRLPEAGTVLLLITDLRGRVIARLEDGVLREAGVYQHRFRDEQLQAGMYVLLLRTEREQRTEKLVFLR